MRAPFAQPFPGGIHQAPHISIPPVDMNEYHSLPDLDSKKQFIGNHIYPSIEQALG